MFSRGGSLLPSKLCCYDVRCVDAVICFKGHDRDIVKSFAESCTSVGVKLGIYYSVVSNEYLNVEGGMVRDPKVS